MNNTAIPLQSLTFRKAFGTGRRPSVPNIKAYNAETSTIHLIK
jgi:hypothetical protein